MKVCHQTQDLAVMPTTACVNAMDQLIVQLLVDL